ncbi:hypothetical protein DXG01_008654 [Tephrocybe rancida]|nr:hypothetical protein DXG01_008654 [Tephrocybe rancida]
MWPHFTGYYVALVIILTLTALITIYHKQIVHWLTPVTLWLHKLKFGWLVPIGVLFVISFPPLFGHEIVAILCGLVWGLWIGFAIVSAGTLLGEIGNFYAFKYCCRARGEKMERTNLTYACLARVVRDGGFKVALIARLSAIPGHFTTAVFSTCGMGIFVFTLAAILSMPKQFITVYLGVILEQSATGEKDKKSTIISDVVLAVTFIITLVAMWYIYHMMNKVKPQVIYARRKARQAKLARAASHSSSSNSLGFSDDDAIPLTLKVHSPSVKRISMESREFEPGYLYAPKPQKRHDLPGPQVTDDVEYGYAGGQGYGHARPRESTDEVGWDLHSHSPMQLAPAGAGVYGYHHASESTSASAETLTGRESRETLMQGGGYGHAAEATGASYRTASEGSDFDAPYEAPPLHLVDPRRPAGAASSSPPPPSYRTDLR